MNQLLRRLEVESLIDLTQKKEVGVVVDNDYWVTIPSDLRRVEKLWYPGLTDFKPIRDIPHEIINGKIKLDYPVELDEDTVDTFTLSSGGTASVVANDADASENLWQNYLLVLTNGTYSGDAIIIGEHDAASGGLVTLNFLHDRATSISDSTAGYLTGDYAMLKYSATFTGLTASTDEVPVGARYEQSLAAGLSYLDRPIDSDERKQYREEFEFELDLLSNEQFTPSPDQARPTPRPMAGLEDCSQFPYRPVDEFYGDADADLE